MLVSLVGLAAIIGLIAAQTYIESPQHRPGSRRFGMDHIFNGTFAANAKGIHWVPEAGDGVFSVFEDNVIKLVDLKTNTSKILVDRTDIKDENGQQLWWSDWQISPDMKYILVKADYRKQWRWSSFGNYYVHNIAEKNTFPVTTPTKPSETAYATWSPTGNSIAYVINNDLYVLTDLSSPTSPIRITSSGNASLFHGVPDWVYEEEIFSGPSALWWSPDSSKLAFLAFDETSVDEFNFPIYNPTEDSDTVVPYTTDVTMKYPKPGYNNPLVSVHVFDLKRHQENSGSSSSGNDATYELYWNDRHPVDNSVIMEVAWVANSSLLLKEVNRNADDGNVVLFDLDHESTQLRSRGTVVRKLGKKGEHGDDGWIDNDQHIHPLPSSLTVGGASGYLDIVPTPEGFNHIALFSPATSRTPKFLTTGKWEVTGGIKGIDPKNGTIYFEAANPSSIERHLYSVPLPASSSAAAVEPAELTDRTKSSYYSSNFSPEAGFYVLHYQGPNVPWQKIVQAGNSTFDYTLTTNEHLLNMTMEYEAPTITRSTIFSEGYELNVQEIRPPRMDDSGRVKYPVLFRVYGGPNSQLVDLKFSRGWHDYLACGLSYIVVIVDGRGTGFKGRKLRNPVKDNLGFYETIDQINAAKIWAAKEYVDRKRIGIWGWSYGGFMASKVAEADAGVHTLSMAVAPVTSWRLYDSIYTERYMNLPKLNPGGYVNASISNVAGFRKVDYLLAHGSADDNVHYANSAHLLDMFTKAQVRNFRFRMFTDSDHSINRRGAQREIYEFLTAFLVEKWGKGGRQRGW
ncbi:dipeptidyl peptidase IV N-terminal region-domain-containing protein [Collybia nuda]|uniref:Dipeptidyl peptidase IV N-terminal region-domain-containing protein n=1 Tax=Collybia nuda TaxID=64659 RepID=A0A9P5YB99_9AGAR|nr:dipeptidyl peptidase IV N-terminal region-domain-containing protein [Collybia nuda]